MFSLVRQSIKRNASMKSVRQMSGSADAAHAKEHMERWINITKGMAVLSGVLFVYNGIAHFSHGHEEVVEDHPPFAYLKIRAKPYPWKYSDCNIFDFECKRKAAAAAEALN